MDIYKSFSVYLCYCICVMYRFMAPEVLLCSVAPTHTVYTNGSAGSYKNSSGSKVGYTNAVDYWSLGNTHVHPTAPTLDPSLSRDCRCDYIQANHWPDAFPPPPGVDRAPDGGRRSAAAVLV